MLTFISECFDAFLAQGLFYYDLEKSVGNMHLVQYRRLRDLTGREE